MTKIILTGGSGFLGSHLLQHNAFYDALVIGRNRPSRCRHFRPLSLDVESDLSAELKGYDIVVHVAGRAHIMNEESSNPISEFRKINTSGTLNLARQAAQAGIKRFIFISSIKVLGENTCLGVPFKSSDSLNPQDPYSVSKAEAEVGLTEIAKESDMDIVIIRPPLIYGNGVKGNFLSLMKIITFKFPLPLGKIKNKRSLVCVENLVDLIVTCLDHPNAKNKCFLVSDGRDLSTSDLLFAVAIAGGYRPWIFRCPHFLSFLFLRLLGKRGIYDRLYGSMQVDIDYTKTQLDWCPPFKVENSLIKCWINFK